MAYSEINAKESGVRVVGVAEGAKVRKEAMRRGVRVGIECIFGVGLALRVDKDGDGKTLCRGLLRVKGWIDSAGSIVVGKLEL